MKAKINKELFSKGNAVVGIIGQGYVGLPLALLFAESGLRTIGFDVDRSKVDMLNRGKSFIEYIPSERIRKLRQKKIYQASDDMRRLGEADAVIICVPTPLSESRDPDLQYVEGTARQIAAVLRPGQLIVPDHRSWWLDQSHQASLSVSRTKLRPNRPISGLQPEIRAMLPTRIAAFVG